MDRDLAVSLLDKMDKIVTALEKLAPKPEAEAEPAPEPEKAPVKTTKK